MRTEKTSIRAAALERRASDSVSRREAIRRISAILGGAVIAGQGAWLSGCATSRPGARTLEELFVSGHVELLDDVADTILPDTATPGARAAGVGPFIAVMVADTYTADEQRIFADGLVTLEAQSRNAFGTTFQDASPQQRTRLLERLDREQFEYTRSLADGEPAHYFRMIKELTLLGYFTSEIGMTQAQRYREAPGRFEPCVPYTPGDRSWAAHA